MESWAGTLILNIELITFPSCPQSNFVILHCNEILGYVTRGNIFILNGSNYYYVGPMMWFWKKCKFTYNSFNRVLRLRFIFITHYWTKVLEYINGGDDIHFELFGLLLCGPWWTRFLCRTTEVSRRESLWGSTFSWLETKRASTFFVYGYARFSTILGIEKRWSVDPHSQVEKEINFFVVFIAHIFKKRDMVYRKRQFSFVCHERRFPILIKMKDKGCDIFLPLKKVQMIQWKVRKGDLT